MAQAAFAQRSALVPCSTLLQVRSLVARCGLYELARNDRDNIVPVLKLAGVVPLEAHTFIDNKVRVFASDSLGRILALKEPDFPLADYSPHMSEMDLFLFEESGNVGPLVQSVSLALQCRLHHMWSWDLYNVDRLKGDLVGLSPNGKLLRRAETQSACERLRSDEYRSQLRTGRAPGRSEMQGDLTVLRTGLWLEWLAYRAMSPFAPFILVGAVLATHELDILAFAASNVILVECKDTSFGERDFMVTAHKAREVHADLIVVVTTHPLHHNVEKSIERFRQQGEEGDERPPLVVPYVAPDSATLEKSLAGAMRKIMVEGVAHWLHDRERSLASDHFFSRY